MFIYFAYAAKADGIAYFSFASSASTNNNPSARFFHTAPVDAFPAPLHGLHNLSCAIRYGKNMFRLT